MSQGIVIDAFAGMLEEGALKHFPLSRCVSRELELLSVKTDKQVVLLEGQQLQVRAKTEELTSEIGNELRVHQAMVRRGLALEMSNLGTCSAREGHAVPDEPFEQASAARLQACIYRCHSAS